MILPKYCFNSIFLFNLLYIYQVPLLFWYHYNQLHPHYPLILLKPSIYYHLDLHYPDSSCPSHTFIIHIHNIVFHIHGRTHGTNTALKITLAVIASLATSSLSTPSLVPAPKCFYNLQYTNKIQSKK